MKDPKVTIVIPVYNGANYVKYAIESAIAQTYKNLEILIVDDGSTDDTEKIVKSFGNKVRYIKKENGGVSSALNLAIKKMKGEYFSWLSHDDTYEPEKIEAEVEFLKENNYLGKKVIVFSDYYLIDKNGKQISEAKKDHDEIVKKPEYILAKGHINGLSLLIPKKAFDDYGEFDTNMACAQDYEMWRLMAKTYKFVHLQKTLVSTRYHAKQVTNTNPKVLTEGNAFYINLINEISPERMIELEGSEYCVMKELEKFYKQTVYEDTVKYCADRAKEILEEAEKEVPKYKVSVIIPFYNRAKKLERAIKSVLKQTHQNFEIILVDDGSTDDRSEIRKIVKENKNIKLIECKTQSGPSNARNIGIKAATGDYIAFLDSDDEFKPKKLEIELKYAIAAKAKILHSSYDRETDGKIKTIHSAKDEGHCERKLMYSCQIATPTVMIDKKWLDKKGVLFNTDIEIGEDVCFWLELMKDNTYLIGIDEPLTIVHVGKNAAAYSEAKQAIGLKEITKYLLNDEYYSKFDPEIARIMQSYIYYVNMSSTEKIEGGMIHKFVFFMKNEGIKSAVKRTGKKIKKVISKED